MGDGEMAEGKRSAMNESHGQVTIAPEVLVTIAGLATQSIGGVAQMCHHIGPGHLDRLLGRVTGRGGVQVAVADGTVRVDVYVIIEPDVNMRSVSRTIQEAVTRAIQDMVGMKVSSVNVHIRDVANNRRGS